VEYVAVKKMKGKSEIELGMLKYQGAIASAHRIGKKPC